MRLVFQELRTDGVLVVTHLGNRGPAAARNSGASSTTADWLVFLDSDDELSPGALAAFAAAVTTDCGLVRARFVRRDEHDDHAVSGFLAGTFAVRRDVFALAGGYDPELRFSENSELLMRLTPALVERGLVETNIDATSAVVRSVGESRNYDEARMRAAIHVLEQHRAHFDADRHDRATHEAIVSVNATRTRHWGTAVRYAALAVRSEPRQPRHYARLGLALLGPLGARPALRR
jgi:glycosyltransferase involved in cell wall biosynthesis